MEKVRGFEVVSKYASETVEMPKRGTKKSACYDIFNNTGADIVIEAEEKSSLKENSSHHSHHYESLDSSDHWKETQTKSRKAHLIKNIVLKICKNNFIF